VEGTGGGWVSHAFMEVFVIKCDMRTWE
jgi:hypothetical protein